MKMKSEMRLRLQTIVVLCTVVLSTANDYENKLTKLWSINGAANSDGSAVLNVTSASIVIQPSSYDSPRQTRPVEYKRYAFKPRAIPLGRAEPVEKPVYYSQDNAQYKPEVLFPGNYFPIAKEKSNVNITKETRPKDGEAFQPKPIPLIRSQEYQQRSLDQEQPIEDIEEIPEQTASRRSISCKYANY
jgi:hypothetical protein